MSIGLKVKPLSVNRCWQGKRFKTPEYKSYEKSLLLMLPNLTVKDCDIRLDLEFGFSSSASDIDNPIKPFVDILQKKYGFNDKKIIELNVKKKKCQKGAEYIIFNIKQLEQ